MTEEYIDIVDSNTIPTGEKALKSEIHLKGHLHNTAHIWLYTNNGQVLLQQRAKTKVICPLLWDVSVAGHIDAGETVKAGAVREIKEEIDYTITENDLVKVGTFECFKTYENGIIDNEFHHTYIAPLNIELKDLHAEPSEVEALKLVSINDFKLLLNNSNTNGHFIASNTPYYLKVLKAITNKLTNGL